MYNSPACRACHTQNNLEASMKLNNAEIVPITDDSVLRQSCRTRFYKMGILIFICMIVWVVCFKSHSYVNLIFPSYLHFEMFLEKLLILQTFELLFWDLSSGLFYPRTRAHIVCRKFEHPERKKCMKIKIINSTPD